MRKKGFFKRSLVQPGTHKVSVHLRFNLLFSIVFQTIVFTRNHGQEYRVNEFSDFFPRTIFLSLFLSLSLTHTISTHTHSLSLFLPLSVFSQASSKRNVTIGRNKVINAFISNLSMGHFLSLCFDKIIA